MSKSAPPAPDYTGAAQAQGQASKDVTTQQIWANRPNQTTPFGSSTWQAGSGIDPSTGQKITNWSNSVALDPKSQASLDAQQDITTGRSQFANKLLTGVRGDFAPGQGIDWNGLPNGPSSLSPQSYDPTKLQTSVGPTQQYNADAGNAIYNQFSNRAEPVFSRQQDDLKSRLYAQGLREGDTSFTNQTRDLNNTQNDARMQASFGATAGAGTQAQRLQGMDLAAGNFGNTAQTEQLQNELGAGNQMFNQGNVNANYINALRQRGIQEGFTRQNQNLNSMNALLTGQQIQNPSFNSFNPAGVAQAPNLLGAAQSQGQYGVDQFNAQQAGSNGLLTGIGTVAAVVF